MVMKLLLVPSALLGVLFPAFAASFEHDRDATALLLDRTLRLMLLAIFPPVLLLVAFAHEGMQLWLGAEFASQSAVVVRWLAAGVLVNSIGQIAFAVVQGSGRSDLTAKLHVAELPFYAVLLFVLTKTMGIAGVAIAWTARVAADTIVLLVFSATRLPEARVYLRKSARLVAVLLAALVAVGVIDSGRTRVILGAVLLVVFAVVGWLQLLRREERVALMTLARLRFEMFES
jgi:O-antigen/teichoic acid export membrane protein